ncbi:MAG: hypothetical protein ACRDN8_16230, partial [Thermoleophilaceae bacterium]
MARQAAPYESIRARDVTDVIKGMDGFRRGLAVTLAALACGAGSALGGGSAQPPQPERTMETVIQDDALLLHRPAAQVRRTAERMANLGADRVRLTASWGALAPGTEDRRKPRFDAVDSREYPRGPFARLDRAVKEVRRAGMDAMIDLAFFAPRWAVEGGSPDRQHVSRPSAREFRLFARAVAERYSGRFTDPSDRDKKLPAVRLWTTWNEPNHPVFLLPQWERVPIQRSDRLRRGTGRRRGRSAVKGAWRPASPHIYRRMHDAAYDQVKAASTDNKVLIGGLASEAERGRGRR